MSHRTTGFLGAMFATLAACGGGSGQSDSPARSPRTVRLVDVGKVSVARTIAVTGVLAAQDELVLGMQVGGRLRTLAVDVGDTVEAGAVVAAMDPHDFELERDRAAAALVAAHARLGLAENQAVADIDVENTAPVLEAAATVREASVQRERVVTMVQEQLRATAELQTADATLAVAQSRLQAARDEVRTWIAEAQQRRVEMLQAAKRLQDSRVAAPWRGRVVARHATAGQVLAAGEPIVTLVRVDPMRLRLQVPERQAPQVSIGQTVNFTVDGRDGEKRAGRVVRLGAAIDRANRTLLVEAEVPNGDGALLPAAFCRCEIVVVAEEAVVAVPRAAVVTFAGVDRVFTVEKDAQGVLRAKGRIVQLARATGSLVEAKRGIEVGVKIVADATGLSPESPVVVAE
ncbi:MAG: efflux RND transporter periplasmic adaptor subunit [Planctomycetes bacterium]|nr:efflux RND transporter periplasmic adaptor subunit [Planctomycetota bacterium]